MPDYSDLIEKHFRRVGLDPELGKRIMRIESGGNAGKQTGSYKGLFQLSNKEFRAGGGSGDIFDPEQNTMAAANKLAREALQFKQSHGHDPSPTDIYMIHQQGAAGYDAHLANPGGTAWQNVHRYYKSDAVAKSAIWGNIPDNLKSQYGSVENVKSEDITGIYGAKMEGKGQVSGAEWAAHRKAKGTDDMPTSRGTGREEEEQKPEDSWINILDKPQGMRVPQFETPQLVPNIQLARGAD